MSSATLATAVQDKHDLMIEQGAARIAAAAALIDGHAVNAEALADLSRRHYDHERWVRRLGHETAARETGEELERARAAICEIGSGILRNRVIDNLLTYDEFVAARMDLGRAARILIDNVIAALRAEGMGSDPLYRATTEGL